MNDSICYRCRSNRPDGGFKSCEPCRAKEAAIRDGRRKQDLCPTCGTQPYKFYAACKECVTRSQEYTQRKAAERKRDYESCERWRREQRIMGRCIICGNRAARDGQRVMRKCSAHLGVPIGKERAATMEIVKAYRVQQKTRAA